MSRFVVKAITFGALVAAHRLAAQASPFVQVHGFAFDSLHGVALPDAFVTMTGGGRTRSATSDARGRFEMDSVLPGTYSLSMQHAAIDSLGFSGFTTRVSVGGVASDIQVSIPSFAVLWRTACGNGAVPRDSGFVFGVVRRADTKATTSALKVDLTWIDITADKSKGISQKRFRATTQTDAGGSYNICGVPLETTLTLQALGDSLASGAVDLLPHDARVQRRDLFVGARGATGRGVVAGTLTDQNGRAVTDARITIEEMPEVRSAADGHFIVRDVPSGTRQIEFLALGLRPVSNTIDVLVGDTTNASAVLSRVTLLDTMRVAATKRNQLFARELDERVKAGLGKFMDSTQIVKLGTMRSVFRNFNGVTVQPKSKAALGDYDIMLPKAGKTCLAQLYVDRIKLPHLVLTSMSPDDIALIEVYAHPELVPFEFQQGLTSCGAIVIWTKSGAR